MSTLAESNQQDLWDSLDERLQAKWAGNTDPWVGPCDPSAVRGELARWQASRNPRQAAREQEPCGCWMRDCGECGPRISDGHRPAAGVVLESSLRSEGLLEQARANGWVRRA